MSILSYGQHGDPTLYGHSWPFCQFVVVKILEKLWETHKTLKIGENGKWKIRETITWNIENLKIGHMNSRKLEHWKIEKWKNGTWILRMVIRNDKK